MSKCFRDNLRTEDGKQKSRHFCRNGILQKYFATTAGDSVFYNSIDLRRSMGGFICESFVHVLCSVVGSAKITARNETQKECRIPSKTFKTGGSHDENSNTCYA